MWGGRVSGLKGARTAVIERWVVSSNLWVLVASIYKCQLNAGSKVERPPFIRLPTCLSPRLLIFDQQYDGCFLIRKVATLPAPGTATILSMDTHRSWISRIVTPVVAQALHSSVLSITLIAVRLY